MIYDEKTARELVVQAGHRLLQRRLVARTWGNISARISETHFVITPSGRAYDTLREEDLVRVSIADCSYEGERKPSSEKGIHAAVYQRRREAGFVIHTHQDYASCVGVSGKDLSGLSHAILGDCVPCAAYGMPSTKKLQKGVEAAMDAHPAAAAILMRHHGALCLAEDMEQAFTVTEALEELSRSVFEEAVTLTESDSADGGALLAALRAAAPDKNFSVETDSAARLIAAEGKTLLPHLDDLAQIAGVDIRCAKNEPQAVLAALKGRNAAFVEGIGAVCCAEDEDDLGAIAAILRKSCMAALYAKHCGAAPLHALDRRIMRLVYTMKYSKKKA